VLRWDLHISDKMTDYTKQELKISLDQASTSEWVKQIEQAGLPPEAIQRMGDYQKTRLFFKFWLEPFGFLTEAQQLTKACPGLLVLFKQKEKFPGLGYVLGNDRMPVFFYEVVPTLPPETRIVYEAQQKMMNEQYLAYMMQFMPKE